MEKYEIRNAGGLFYVYDNLHKCPAYNANKDLFYFDTEKDAMTFISVAKVLHKCNKDGKRCN